MNEYIKRESAINFVEKYTPNFDGETTMQCVRTALDNVPAADVVEVRHGEWNLEVHSFYMDTWDESPELCVYILASCSNCGEEHSPKEVFSMHVYAPEGVDCDYRFDKEYEEAKALEKFKQCNYEFQNYCPNCGAKMDLKD